MSRVVPSGRKVWISRLGPLKMESVYIYILLYTTLVSTEAPYDTVNNNRNLIMPDQ